jgi:hypothetical protein
MSGFRTVTVNQLQPTTITENNSALGEPPQDNTNDRRDVCNRDKVSMGY